MKFDFHTFATDASAILGAVQRMAPIASELGIPFVSTGAALAGKIAEVGQAALDQADNLETALTSEDQATLTDLITKLNDEAAKAEAAADEAEKEALDGA